MDFLHLLLKITFWELGTAQLVELEGLEAAAGQVTILSLVPVFVSVCLVLN